MNCIKSGKCELPISTPGVDESDDMMSMVAMSVGVNYTYHITGRYNDLYVLVKLLPFIS